MAEVKSRKGEPFESLLRRFRRAVEQDGIMRELKKRKHYLSPSEKKKEKRKLAEKRRRKEKSRK
jgi:small subunit ribosomal protein S21